MVLYGDYPKTKCCPPKKLMGKQTHSYVQFLIIWVYLLDIYGIPLFWTIPIYSLNSIAISTFDLPEKSLSKGTPVWQSW